MESLRFLNRQAVSFALAIGILFAMLIPVLVPAVVSAAQITDRSLAMSTSAASASSVSYDISFKVSASGAAGAYVIDFCKNSAVVGSSCTAPDGFNVSGATTDTASTTLSALDTPRNNAIVVTQSVANSATATVVLDDITNPSYVTDDTDGFYARIVTYDTEEHAQAYASASLGTGAIDGGSIPLATTSSIGISAAVRETLVFCVSGSAITADCGTTTAPNVTLGTNGALDAGTIDTGSVFTQITTNAAGGAVINLKSNTTGCGGLVLFGSSACNIGPALTPTGATGLDAAGKALFGVKTNAPSASDGAASAMGTLQEVDASGYNDTTYFMGYVTGDATGVTSPYGDPMLDTDGGPINNQNMELTFGASISANTPAGNYSATLNMIATGTY